MITSGSDWARLFRIARSLIQQVNAEHVIIDSWSLGGGTAMMLQIDHRQSDDIDIFLQDPQLLSYLDPKLRDFKFEIMPSDYHGDGFQFLKLAFDRVGEIDFIVSPPLTNSSHLRREVDGEAVDVETVAEIITKKVHFRGAHIKPRDIFDIAAGAKTHRTEIVHALQAYKDDVSSTLAAIDRLNPDFVRATIDALAIKPEFRPVGQTALDDARKLLGGI